MKGNIAARAEEQKSPIVELGSDDLKPGVIWNSFQDGAKAIHLVRDSRVEFFWNELVTNQMESTHGPFWENGIRSFARNHGEGQKNVGDMLRFVPGTIGHIARKVIVYPELGGSRLLTIPNHFWREDEKEVFPQEILKMVWDFATEVFESSMPDDFEYPPCAVAIEFLKYPNSLSELDRIFDLLDDSSFGWTLAGKKMDMFQRMAAGPFNLKLIRQLFALGSLIPRLSRVLHKINNSFIDTQRQGLAEGLNILGEPHLDSSRALTMLASDRDMISTDIFDGTQWHELPMDTNSLFIFPGTFLSEELGLEPTLHRYSIKTQENQSTTPKTNLSLLFGLVDRESYIPLSKFFM